MSHRKPTQPKLTPEQLKVANAFAKVLTQALKAQNATRRAESNIIPIPKSTISFRNIK